MIGSTWRRVRGWLRLGPSRADLIDEARMWRHRCERSNLARDEAYGRAKAAKKEMRAVQLELDAARRAAQLELDAARRQIDDLRELVADGLNQPDKADGCHKVRFHWRSGAQEWAASISRRTGEPLEVYDTFPCKVCPRSPVTMRRYWHVGHFSDEAAQASKRAVEDRKGSAKLDARRAGKLVEQRLDPAVRARLDQFRRGDG